LVESSFRRRPLSPPPACGERSDRITRCDPGEGIFHAPWWKRLPLTPTLSRKRGEGVHFCHSTYLYQAPGVGRIVVIGVFPGPLGRRGTGKQVLSDDGVDA